MRGTVLFSYCLLLSVGFANRAAAQANVLRPGDPIILVNGVNDGDADSGPPPGGEGVEHAIDGFTQKYLNFLDLGSGFRVLTPSGTIVNGLRFYTANDAEPRDPASYVLEGSPSGSLDWIIISSGSLSLPSNRNPGGNVPVNPAVHFNQLVSFPNTAVFTQYRVTFPTLKDAASANSMQIGEVELLTTRISVARQDSGLIISGIATEPANLALETSTDLVHWTWRAYLTADVNGVFQFVEPDITAPPLRFYRLVSAGQFPSGLVSWWRGENDYRDSFGPNHGSAFSNAGPTFAAGQRGQALSFNGTTEAMFIGGAPIPSPWTACFWVKRQDATEPSAALLTDTSTGLKLEQWMFTRQVGFTAFGVADYSFAYSVPADVWTHLTFVSAPEGTIIYTNGVAVETNAATINLPLNILGARDTGHDYLQGQLDETTLFNRALSPAEIQQVIVATSGPNLPAGLVTWWRGENDYRDSFGTNHGSAFSNAGPTFVAGQRGQALSFNGTTEAMFIGGAPIPNPWTACFWIKRQDATEPSAALLTDPFTALKLEQWMFTRQVGFTAFGVADYSFNYSVPADVWTHLTFVSSEAGTIIYANGTAVETNAATINLPVNILGARETGHDYLQGQLDETTLFNRALSPAEIQQVLNETRGPKFPPGLVTWWRFENDYRDSFGTNHGSAFSNAGPSFVAGQRGQALSFNGTTEAMFIGGPPIPSPWTACFWVKRQDATEPSAALLTDPATALKLEQWMFTRQVGFTAFGVADYSFAYSVPADVWTHLTFVSAPEGTIVYANGTAVETNTATINLPLNILGARENGHDYLQGQLDESTLFNRALSPAEIRQVLNETRGP